MRKSQQYNEKGFDSETEFNRKYLKIRINYYGDNTNTNFHDGKMFVYINNNN